MALVVILSMLLCQLNLRLLFFAARLFKDHFLGLVDNCPIEGTEVVLNISFGLGLHLLLAEMNG